MNLSFDPLHRAAMRKRFPSQWLGNLFSSAVKFCRSAQRSRRPRPRQEGTALWPHCAWCRPSATASHIRCSSYLHRQLHTPEVKPRPLPLPAKGVKQVRSFMREKKIYCGKHYREVDIYPYHRFAEPDESWIFWIAGMETTAHHTRRNRLRAGCMAAGPQRKIFRTIYRPCGNVAATSTWAFRWRRVR